MPGITESSTCQVVKLCPRHYNISRVISHLDAQQHVLPGAVVAMMAMAAPFQSFDEGRDCVVDSDASKGCLIGFSIVVFLCGCV